jgi:cell wall-associated NlpC family hydrolase
MYFKVLLISFLSMYIFTGCTSMFNNKITTIPYYKNKYENDYQIKNYPIVSASLENLLRNQKIKNIQENQTNDISFEDTPAHNINQNLYEFYNEWKGVKYKLGGNSKSGIDCSALMQIAYKENFNLNLPRTTTNQAKLGKEIDKSELVAGDLIFFKTGRNSRHVGIYIENGKFIHASTKRGVTISKIDNIYFSKHYWKSQRVIN